MWSSQPLIKNRPARNILLSAAILFSGSTPTKVFRFLKCLQVACFSDCTFYDHQTEYLEPAIISVWKHKQLQLLNECISREIPLVIGGDGRADSPGHSAKFGSYSIIDLNTSKLLQIELVQVKYTLCMALHIGLLLNCLQSNEVKSSNLMELERLKRALKFLADNQLEVDTLITDRHKQINKYLRERHSDITHRYDVWHIFKSMHNLAYIYICTFHKIMMSLTGVKKKLASLATASECEIVGEWTKSIIDHLHWCAASVTAGDEADGLCSKEDEIVKKWRSLMDHLCNIHDNCYHDELNSLEERRKKWLIPGS